MIKNNIKIAFRTFWKNKAYFLINILGLTIGLAACMLMATMVIDDLSYDKFWKRSDNLYKVNLSNKVSDGIYDKQSIVPIGIGLELKESFPELENFASIRTSDLRLKISQEQPDGISARVMNADSSATALLDFEVLSGQDSPFIVGHDNLLITESFRDKYFKGEDPVGKIIYDVPSWQNEAQAYLITAVIKDIPQNTHLRAEAVVLRKPRGERLDKSGASTYSELYFLLKPETNVQVFTDKVNHWYYTFLDNGKEKETLFSFQPIKDVYLRSDFNNQLEVKSNLQAVYLSGAVGVLLLLIACINFINLSIARAFKRLKETGLRKILGANRKQLIGLFLTESLVFFSISTLLACLLYMLSIPPLESFLGHRLTYSLLSGLPLFSITIGVVFVISLLTGIYPALLMSNFNVANSLKGKPFSSSLFAPNALRKGLVVVQFSIAIAVFIALLVVHSQLNYLDNKDLGYNKDQLMHIGLRSWEGKGEAFKTELKNISGVEAVSIAGWDPRTGSPSMSMTGDHPNKEGEKFKIGFIMADFDFVETLGMSLEDGRVLNPQYGNDAYSLHELWNIEPKSQGEYINSRSVLVNHSTARMLGINTLNESIKKIGYTPVGILKDFHTESLHKALEPVFILGQNNPDYAYMFIRITPGQEKQVLPAISQTWRQFYPDKLLDANWVADILQKQYSAEQKQRILFMLFSGLMLFLSSLGVLGLIMHTAELRIKEIGIRKVLGASVAGIVRMLSGDFVKLVFIAVLIASPIAWWAMNKWLQDFAYRIDIEWWMFALAGMMAIVVAIFTVATQAVKAAVANPVDSLRDE